MFPNPLLLLLLLLLLLQSDTALASRLFAALGAEPPGSRAALQEALGGLAAAMGAGIQATAAGGGAAAAGTAAAGGGGLPASKVQELERLLLSSIGSEQVGRPAGCGRFAAGPPSVCFVCSGAGCLQDVLFWAACSEAKSCVCVSE
jgi:hypothetical protein